MTIGAMHGGFEGLNKRLAFLHEVVSRLTVEYLSDIRLRPFD